MAELTGFILGGINSRQESWPIKYSLAILWSRIFRKSVGSKNMVLKDTMFCRKTDNHKREKFNGNQSSQIPSLSVGIRADTVKLNI